MFFDRKQFTFRWLSALVWAKNEFYNNDVKVIIGNSIKYFGKINFISEINKILKGKYDIVFLAYHRTSGFFDLGEEKVLKFLEDLKKRCNRLVWLDTSDGTGTSQFEVLPYVDIYLKKQLLINKKLYLTDFFGERIYLDYYHKEGYLSSSNTQNNYRSFINNETYLSKLDISWNIGLGDYFSSKLKFVFNKNRTKDRTKIVDIDRDNVFDIHFRGSINKNNIGFQRKLAFDSILKSELKHPDYSFDPKHKVYLKELNASKSVISPFGFGEICVRDFEAFSNGCALFKPSVSHMATFPNYYVENETYIPVKWDFSDSKEKYNLYLKNDSYKDIARNGQKRFNYYKSIDGKKEFVKHIIDVIGIRREK